MKWEDIIKEESQKTYYPKLQQSIEASRQRTKVFPTPPNVYAALDLTPLESVRVVILGQDPYHGWTVERDGTTTPQANGLAFSVPRTSPIPPSLRNIFIELKDDVGIVRSNGDLSGWAKQGVLLLNTSLTVVANQPASHSGIGWSLFTSRLLRVIAENSERVVFVAWGLHAQGIMKELSDDPILKYKHRWLSSSHPSPLSYARSSMNCIAFKGSKPFSGINNILEANGGMPIDWSK